VTVCAGYTCVKCARSTFGDFHFTARHFWGFPHYSPALFGISTLPSGAIKDSPLCHPLNGKRALSNASTAIKNQIFGAGVTKNVIFKYNLAHRFQYCPRSQQIVFPVIIIS